jgi:hypothetical protein
VKDAGIVAAKLATDAVETAKIKDANVTTAKLEYKEYVALLNQTGTNAPVATVIKNTLSETPAPSYTSAGYYKLTAVGTIFTANKTIVLITLGDQTTVGIVRGKQTTTTAVDIFTDNMSSAPTNGLLVNATIIIRVYP